MHNKKQVIIKTDGGICSQIAFCALGNYFEGLGYEVKYDTSWFEEYGEKLSGVDIRKYVMDKAFPTLNFKIATQEEIKYYKKHYNVRDNVEVLKNKMYVEGYPSCREKLFIENVDFFKKYFDPIDKDSVSFFVKEIEENNSCAIHVRRGDLSQYNQYYGNPADVDYFLKAIRLIQSFNENVRFFFFSEEPQWIKDNILPKIGDTSQYKIIENNDSTKGYLDLYLISKCKHIIASNGSFGIFGKVLSDAKTTLVSSKPNDLYCRVLENIYIINKPNTIPPKIIFVDYLSKYKKYKKIYKICLTLVVILFVIVFYLVYKLGGI